jgi:hypothetical protein
LTGSLLRLMRVVGVRLSALCGLAAFVGILLKIERTWRQQNAALYGS